MRPPPTTKNFHKKTVFAWRTFDLLHAGHIEYLEKARALGDYLIGAIYSDAVVSWLYGKSRSNYFAKRTDGNSFLFRDCQSGRGYGLF